MTAPEPFPNPSSGPILAGVADDARSDDAARTAQALGRRLSRDVRFVHAVPNVILQDDESHALERIEAAREAVARHLDAVLGAGARDRLEVSNGPADELLARIAEARRASLLVLGPHAEPLPTDGTPLVEALLDRGVRVPLWCQRGPWRDPRRVVVATDLSDASRDAARWAYGLARGLGAELVVVHVFEPPWFAGGPPPEPVGPTYVVDQERAQVREQLEAFVARAGVRCTARLAEGVPAPTLLEQHHEDDVLVLAPHEPALLGSVSREVLDEAHDPVVLVPPAPRER